MKKAFSPNSSTSLSRFIWQTLLIDTTAAIVVIALNYVRFGWQNTISAENLVSSLVYSYSIGTLCGMVVMRGVPLFYDDSALLRFAKMIIAIFIATLFGITIGNFLMIIFGFESWSDFSVPSLNKVVFSLIIAFSFGISAYFYEISQVKLRQKEIDEANAKTLATEAQLASLESRIHPHFLFNTLNSIAALIRENPHEAEKMVEKLAALLRYSLDSNAGSLVSLEKELEITRKYLEIEKARFGDRLSYKIETGDEFKKLKVPMLSLQTLVENSIKHVASKSSKQTEISVSAKYDGANFQIEVNDNGAGFSAAELKEGHGLDNLQKRLKNIFGENADLEIIKNGAGGKARLKIPAENV